MLTNYAIEDYEFNTFQEKVMEKYVEIIRPDMSVLTIKESIRQNMYKGIGPDVSVKWLSEQIEKVEDEDGGINL